ncbi:hypothetical protein MAR_030441 [Mya arenaria]|uniref:Uncharacterized protein n=1 Tax=Mya arenaria TaxID=6604 RepID=A0ABY7F0Y2_MYAAR|nr:hypothetical protein MAR_030441 [Mya arenaria]
MSCLPVCRIVAESVGRHVVFACLLDCRRVGRKTCRVCLSVALSPSRSVDMSCLPVCWIVAESVGRHVVSACLSDCRRMPDGAVYGIMTDGNIYSQLSPQQDYPSPKTKSRSKSYWWDRSTLRVQVEFFPPVVDHGRELAGVVHALYFARHEVTCGNTGTFHENDVFYVLDLFYNDTALEVTVDGKDNDAIRLPVTPHMGALRGTLQYHVAAIVFYRMYKKYCKDLRQSTAMAAPAEVEYNFLGNTGVKVSNLGLGTMTFGSCTDVMVVQ